MLFLLLILSLAAVVWYFGNLLAEIGTIATIALVLVGLLT